MNVTLFIFCGMWALAYAYYPMVFEVFNSCKYRLYQTKMLVSEEGCRNMSGFYLRNENPPYCEVQLCKVPGKAQIADRSIWGLGTRQAVENAAEDDKVSIKWTTSRGDCERLTGQPQLTKAVNVECDLTLIRQTDPHMAKLTGIMPFAGKDECPSKAGSIQMGLTGFSQESCEILNGSVRGSGCWLDLCYTDAVQCIPTDGWNHVQKAKIYERAQLSPVGSGQTMHLMCVNDASKEIKCIVSFEEGITNTEGRSSSESKAVGASVTAEVSADIMGLFSATVSTTVSGDFSWASETSNEATWSQSTTHTMEVMVPPKKTMTIQQLVGVCGSIRVKTKNLRALESSNPA